MNNFIPVLFILCMGLLTKTRALYSLFLVLMDLRRHGVIHGLWDSFCLDSFFLGACSLRHCSSIKMPESNVSYGLIGRLSKAS